MYALAGVASCHLQNVMVACLWAGPGAAASHRTAAALWGFYENRAQVIDVMTARKIDRPPSEIQVHRTAPLRPADVAAIGALPITKPERTLMALAGVVSVSELELSIDDALRKCLITLEGLRSQLETLGCRGRNGTANMRRLLEARTDGYRPTESRLEDAFLRLLRKHDLLLPQRQREVRRRSQLIGRIDFVYVEARIAIELDGYGFHSDRAAFQRDRARNNQLALEGYLPLRYTWDDVHKRPLRVIAELSEALAARAPGPFYAGKRSHFER
ncbi:MAG: DUF559 domain-containing protein [Actinobacteria bacterium]|nr:DUF559 domain-containing protein [Actinomycetota bacterium]